MRKEERQRAVRDLCTTSFRAGNAELTKIVNALQESAPDTTALMQQLKTFLQQEGDAVATRIREIVPAEHRKTLEERINGAGASVRSRADITTDLQRVIGQNAEPDVSTLMKLLTNHFRRCLKIKHAAQDVLLFQSADDTAIGREEHVDASVLDFRDCTDDPHSVR